MRSSTLSRTTTTISRKRTFPRVTRSSRKTPASMRISTVSACVRRRPSWSVMTWSLCRPCPRFTALVIRCRTASEWSPSRVASKSRVMIFSAHWSAFSICATMSRSIGARSACGAIRWRSIRPTRSRRCASSSGETRSSEFRRSIRSRAKRSRRSSGWRSIRRSTSSRTAPRSSVRV